MFFLQDHFYSLISGRRGSSNSSSKENEDEDEVEEEEVSGRILRRLVVGERLKCWRGRVSPECQGTDRANGKSWKAWMVGTTGDSR